MNYKKYFLGTIFFSIVLLIIFLTVEMSSLGAEVSYLENTNRTLLKENRNLNEVLSEKSSLDSVGKKAEVMEFDRPEEIVYLKVVESIAKLP